VVTIPDLPEWDKSLLLNYEREMLGLYVSDHPLFGLEHVISANSDVSIADIQNDELPHDRAVQVAGMVSGLQRKVTKQGASWAIVTLESLDGVIDVMVFPQTYSQYGQLIAPDSIIQIRGRLDKREEDAPKFVALEISIPQFQEIPVGALRLYVPAQRLIPPLVEKLKAVLASHPGTTEVQLEVIHADHTTALRLDANLSVSVSPGLYGDLKQLLGANCLTPPKTLVS
jgi:DNA polymerase-3 subunit alpha